MDFNEKFNEKIMNYFEDELNALTTKAEDEFEKDISVELALNCATLAAEYLVKKNVTEQEFILLMQSLWIVCSEDIFEVKSTPIPTNYFNKLN